MLDESEGLIRTFDALLMIARAESGHSRDNMTDFDAAEIVRGVGELYEPVAEEKGLSLRIEAADGATIKGNRELLSQALANLVDNAIKYSAPRRRRHRGAGDRPLGAPGGEPRADRRRGSRAGHCRSRPARARSSASCACRNPPPSRGRAWA